MVCRLICIFHFAFFTLQFSLTFAHRQIPSRASFPIRPRHGEILLRVCVPGSQPDRLFEVMQCPREVAVLSQRNTQIIVCLRVIWTDPQGPPIGFDRVIDSAEVLVRNAEPV